MMGFLTPFKPRGKGVGRHYGLPVDWLAPWLATALLLFLFASTEAIGSTRDGVQYPPLFGTVEKRANSINLFPKWKGTLDRYFRERKLEDAPCDANIFNRCHLRKWKAFLAKIKGKDRMTQLREVNTYMNRAPYIVDQVNYGVPDYWATPRQFFRRDGDCEDYAIAKYLSLRALGLSPDAMRVVVLQDENLKLAHAVLVVYLEGRAYVLDNQIKTVVEASRIFHYRPIYSINERYWWVHLRR